MVGRHLHREAVQIVDRGKSLAGKHVLHRTARGQVLERTVSTMSSLAKLRTVSWCRRGPQLVDEYEHAAVETCGKSTWPRVAMP